MRVARVLIMVALLCLLALAKKKPNPKPDPEPITPDTPIEKKDLVYKFTVARGFLEGVYQGYYRQPRFELDSRCLGDDTISAIQGFEMIVGQKKFLQWYDTMTDLYMIASTTDKYCNVQKIITDSTVFVAENEITGQVIYENFSQNLFNVIDKVNNIMS